MNDAIYAFADTQLSMKADETRLLGISQSKINFPEY